VQSPQAALSKMLQHLYPAWTEAHAHGGHWAAEQAEKPCAYRSQHRYTVQSVCGMSSEELRAALADAALALQ